MPVPFQITPVLRRKCDRLEEALSRHHRIAVAYSGGADSAFLAWFALKILKKDVYGFLAVTPLLGRRERTFALETAAEIGLRLEELEVDPTSDPSVRENSRLRCYHCKMMLMGRVKRRALEIGCTVFCDGTHADDSRGPRPGRKALEELGFSSPLSEAGITKPEIRELSRLAGLSTWDKPSQSCLATRIPYGILLAPQLLERIERAEDILWDIGVKQVRVRAHGDLARIEADPDSFRLLVGGAAPGEISRRLKELGFVYVTIDLEGFRSGSLDEPSDVIG